MKAIWHWLHAFRPAPLMVSGTESLRACIGTLLGIMITGTVTTWVIGDTSMLPALIGPMGAASVLLFAVPASPLAQPWPALVGSLISALIGVTCALLISSPLLAAAVAVSVAIGAMSFLRCLHPPGGSIALLAVLSTPLVHKIGYGFVLIPALLNAGILWLVALIYNNATGRRYPHVQARAKQTASRSTANAGFVRADMEAVLHRHAEVFDIGRDDLEMLLREVEEQAEMRRRSS